MTKSGLHLVFGDGDQKVSTVEDWSSTVETIGDGRSISNICFFNLYKLYFYFFIWEMFGLILMFIRGDNSG